MKNNSLHNDKVTVVTVTYNAKDFLEETILSVINQSYDNIEYIIIDGGSTDGTIDIIKKYEDKIDYWISEPDDGLYYAMNKAIEKATGEWINFMNAGDTFFDFDTVNYIMEHKSNDAELIYGDFSGKDNKILFHANAKELWYKTMPFCHQTLFTLTNIMKTTPFNTDFKLAADHDFIIKMYDAKKNFNYINKHIAIFDQSGFAQNNLFLSYVESLNILLHSNASKEDIESSWWYKGLKTDLSSESIARVSNLEMQMQELQDTISKLSGIKFLYHPIKKYNMYKSLLALNTKLRG